MCENKPKLFQKAIQEIKEARENIRKENFIQKQRKSSACKMLIIN